MRLKRKLNSGKVRKKTPTSFIFGVGGREGNEGEHSPEESV